MAPSARKNKPTRWSNASLVSPHSPKKTPPFSDGRQRAACTQSTKTKSKSRSCRAPVDARKLYCPFCSPDGIGAQKASASAPPNQRRCSASSCASFGDPFRRDAGPGDAFQSPATTKGSVRSPVTPSTVREATLSAMSSIKAARRAWLAAAGVYTTAKRSSVFA